MNYESLRAAGRLTARELPGGAMHEQIEKDRGISVCRQIAADGTLDVIASDETVDRYGDVIDAAGWDLEAYKGNPVVLLDHNYRVSQIVGTVERAAIEANALRVRIQVDPAETSDAAALVHGKLAAGSLRTVSVGFIPKRWEPILDLETGAMTGFRFLESELLEISFVAVPANPAATIE